MFENLFMESINLKLVERMFIFFYMGLDARKPVLGVSKNQKCIPACAV